MTRILGRTMSLSPVIEQDRVTRVRASMLGGLIKTLRPHQWVKNFTFVVAPMFFHKDLVTTVNGTAFLNIPVVGRSLLAAGIFCLLAGAVYTINDLADVAADRVHPVKRDRPIASGVVPESAARAMAVMLVIVSLGMAFLLDWRFAVVAVIYEALFTGYTFKLKKVAFLDVGILALGFVLRVMAGGYATNVKVSGYMLACTALLPLFLGFGKRPHEPARHHAGKQPLRPARDTPP